MTDRAPLVVTPENVGVGFEPTTGDVFFSLNVADAIGLDPRFHFVVRLSPSEARRIARLINDKAAEAEASRPST